MTLKAMPNFGVILKKFINFNFTISRQINLFSFRPKTTSYVYMSSMWQTLMWDVYYFLKTKNRQ